MVLLLQRVLQQTWHWAAQSGWFCLLFLAPCLHFVHPFCHTIFFPILSQRYLKCFFSYSHCALSLERFTDTWFSLSSPPAHHNRFSGFYPTYLAGTGFYTPFTTHHIGTLWCWCPHIVTPQSLLFPSTARLILFTSVVLALFFFSTSYVWEHNNGSVTFSFFLKLKIYVIVWIASIRPSFHCSIILQPANSTFLPESPARYIKKHPVLMLRQMQILMQMLPWD